MRIIQQWLFCVWLSVFCAYGSTIPERYGAACEREDTTRGSLLASFTDSTRSGASDMLWNVALSGSGFKIGNTSFSVKTGLYNHLKGPFSPVMQQLALSRSCRNTTLQLGVGYQPVRKNEQSYEAPVNFNDELYVDHMSIDILNTTRFLGRLNGITDIDSRQRLVYGVEIEVESRSGISLYRSVGYGLGDDYLEYPADYEPDHDYMDYSEYGDGDGCITFVAGAGYWRDFVRHEKRYKSLLLVESFFNREKQALRFNRSIVPYLQYLQEHTDHYDSQYAIVASGKLNKQSGVGIRYVLSSRFLPMTPLQYNRDGMRNNFTQGVEYLDISLSFTSNYVVNVKAEELTFPPVYIQGRWWAETYGSYAMRMNYSWRLFLNIPWSTPAAMNSLAARLTWQSESEFKDRYDSMSKDIQM